MTTPPGLSITRDGAVHILSFDRPTLTKVVHDALPDALDELATGEDARCLVLLAPGDDFSSGAEPAFLQSMLGDRQAMLRGMEHDQRIIRTVRDIQLPIVAAINGKAVGIACTLALLADFLIMSDDATLQDRHVNIGLVCGDGGGALLPNRIGVPRAKLHLLTGDPITAADADRYGLTAQVVPRDDLHPAALALARRLAAQPARALQLTKKAIDLGARETVSTVLEYASLAEFETIQMDEFAEAVRRLLPPGS